MPYKWIIHKLNVYSILHREIDYLEKSTYLPNLLHWKVKESWIYEWKHIQKWIQNRFDMIWVGNITLYKSWFCVYSVSSSPCSDVARLFAKRSSKSCAPSEISHTGLHTYKNKECVEAITSRTCRLTLLPGDGETEYSARTLLGGSVCISIWTCSLLGS